MNGHQPRIGASLIRGTIEFGLDGGDGGLDLGYLDLDVFLLGGVGEFELIEFGRKRFKQVVVASALLNRKRE